MKPEGLFNSMRGIGRPVAYYPSFAKFLGSSAAAIFVCQFIYWEGKQEDEEGWIYKRSADLARETGLGRYEIEGARKRLIQYGLMTEKKTGSPPQMFYKFHWDIFEEKFSEFIKNNYQPPKKTKKAKPAESVDPEEEKKVNELGLFKDEFDLYYQKQYDNPYLWSKDRKGGKDWFHLREIRDKIVEWRKVKIKKQQPNLIEIEIKFDDVLAAWIFLLEKMPKYHREINFSPANINSKFNDIVRDILNAHNESKQQPSNNRNEEAAAASQFV